MSMMLFRPVQQHDLEFLIQLAGKAGTGLTTLPQDEGKLNKKIEHSIQSFNDDFPSSKPQSYLFVLEDTSTGKIVGTSGLIAKVGLDQAFYTYKVGRTVHCSPKHAVNSQIDTLFLGNDYTGSTEICTLFLDPAYRKNNNGKMLSKSRFLYMADHSERFAKTVIAEMRGYSDENGISPFWEGLGRLFFDMDFAEADRLSGMGDNGFIAELMPKHPIYVSLLPAAAQKVIGQVHPETRPALSMLKREGFHYRNYVDIFDAGPTIEADIEHLHTITGSKVLTVSAIEKNLEGPKAIIGNREQQFCSVIDSLKWQNEQCTISASCASRLKLNINDTIRAYWL